MASKIKVRFNLGRGKNYLKWKVQSGTESIYYSPEEVNILMTGCILKNNKKAAERIHQGENKNVCAWILCDEIYITRGMEAQTGGERLKYNPRVAPNWVADSANVDGAQYETVYSDGRQLFGIK